MNLTPEQQKLLANEIGGQVISRMRDMPVPPEMLGRVVFPRCPHCKRRPTLMPMRGSWLTYRTGFEPPEIVAVPVPRYEILPCCSAKYIIENEGPTRKEKLRAAASKN
jgi:hypothetical protein